ALPWGKDVYDDLTYCLSQWQEAGYKAAMALPGPSESGSTLDWYISLIGNLAWAATVYFPPAFAVSTAAKVTYATASTATKAASMIGATLAAGVVPQLRALRGKLNSPQGKAFLSNYLGSQVPDILNEYAKDADAWVKEKLFNHFLAEYESRW